MSEIEYDRRIANYKDMRAHFAVVCADRGCLPIKAGAYTGKQLDHDLDKAAKTFVNDPRQFSVDQEKGEVQISIRFLLARMKRPMPTSLATAPTNRV